MGLIVQKFGGTSVRTPEARAQLVQKVQNEINSGNQVVVVVSAMGRFGEPYATDTLIHLLEDNGTEISPRKKDLIMSCGEIISCSVIAQALEGYGLPAEPLTGFQAGIVTDDKYNASSIKFINTSTVNEILKSGKIPVIAGFQGSTSGLELTTLGRGGSDTSAVVIGGYLCADRVDIYTDVKGIAEIDPRIVPEAAYLRSISYDDMIKLASHGAKVIHPRAVMAAKNFNIPVVVRSTFLDDMGTSIDGTDPVGEKGPILGITIQKSLMRLSAPPRSMHHPFLAELSLYHCENGHTYEYFIEEESRSLIDKTVPSNIQVIPGQYGRITVFFNRNMDQKVRESLSKSLQTSINTVYSEKLDSDTYSCIVENAFVNESAEEIYNRLIKFETPRD